jgi:PKD repeat protein
MNKSNRKLLPAVATAVVVLLVMCGTGSAGYIAITKDTSTSDPALYRVGDTVTYNMTVAIHENLVTPPPNYWFKVDVYDTYPNGTVELLESGLELFYNGTKAKQYVRTYVVVESDINTSWTFPGHWVINYVNATGIDNLPGTVAASTDCPSKIARDPEANFTFDAGDCDLKVWFYPSATDPDGTIVKYEWDFENDGMIDKTTASNSSFSHIFPASGDYNVKLTVTDNDGLTDWIVKTVHITAPPTVSVTASPASVDVPPGGWVTVTGTVSDKCRRTTWRLGDSYRNCF